MRLTPAQAAARLAADVDLDLDHLRICLMCLFVVSCELESGEERKIRGALVRMTPDLWAEGLAAPARAAVAAAAARGVPGADRALLDIDTRGSRTPIARALVRKLAAQLSLRAHAEWAAQWN